MHEIFRIQKDPERAKALIKAAKQRFIELDNIRNLVSGSRIIEFYYDIIKELILALMYKDGYKTLSHVAMIEYLRVNSSYFGDGDIALIDSLRRKRNDISYYGKTISSSFLFQKEDQIRQLICNFLETL